MAITKEDFLKEIEKMSVSDLNDLVEGIKERFNVTGVVAVAAGGAAGGGAADAEEAKKMCIRDSSKAGNSELGNSKARNSEIGNRNLGNNKFGDNKARNSKIGNGNLGNNEIGNNEIWNNRKLGNIAGVVPHVIGHLPPHLAALMRTNINVQELAVIAALEKKKDYLYYAAMMDPHTSSELALDDIYRLVDEMVDSHADYLPCYH